MQKLWKRVAHLKEEPAVVSHIPARALKSGGGIARLPNYTQRQPEGLVVSRAERRSTSA